MVENHSDIIKFLASHKVELGHRFGVTSLGLFGSHARSEAREDSDIDIAVELRPEHKSLRNFLGLRRYLERELGRPSKRPETPGQGRNRQGNHPCLSAGTGSIAETFSRRAWRSKAMSRGLTSVLIHEYFGADLEIVRNTVRDELPQLMAAVQAMENGVR